MSTTEEDVREIFATNRLNEDKIRALVAYIDSEIDTAWPNRTHVEVEQVEAYGLDLGIDANGYAARVTFPYGAQT